MTYRPALLVGLLAGSIASGAFGQSDSIPKFESFPVTVRYSGAPAAVDLRSATGASRFSTVLRHGAKRGPNFAGHFTIVEWGCGSPCQTMAIVDARTGKVFLLDLTSVKGFVYRLDSSLLITEPLDEWRADMQKYPDWEPLVREVRFFNWQSPYLVAVDSIEISRDLLR